MAKRTTKRRHHQKYRKTVTRRHRLVSRLSQLARRARYASAYTRVRVQDLIARLNRQRKLSNAQAERLLGEMKQLDHDPVWGNLHTADQRRAALQGIARVNDQFMRGPR